MTLILITDRGRVVAEIREPSFHGAAQSALEQKENVLVERGLLTRGLPNQAEVYRAPATHLPASVIDRALAQARDER